MDPRVALIANGFYFVAALIGIPSLAGTLFFGGGVLLANAYNRKQQKSPAIPRNSDGVLFIILGMAALITGAANALGKVGGGVLKWLAAASIGVLLIAAALYFIGRGLHAHSDWARWIAMLLMIPASLISLGASLSRLNPFVRILALAAGSAGGYAIFILWTAQ